ncbi:hypothetical protein MPRG_54580 [Mycobacterium paragordonae]|uniref:Uncharacterized protein n=1 Tax=Mycobacterium paragordonae TaxID=1389713 RepID=A0ABQ1CD91_9MYCO|nr:hypothetical protein MPRG_54580 [Mycobacterium paragordonae]
MSRPIAPDGTIRVSNPAALAVPADPSDAVTPPNATDSTATHNSRSTIDRPLMSTLHGVTLRTTEPSPQVANHTRLSRIRGRRTKGS